MLAGFTSVIKPNGEQVVVTADGREIAAGDTVSAGGVWRKAQPRRACLASDAERGCGTSSLRSASFGATEGNVLTCRCPARSQPM